MLTTREQKVTVNRLNLLDILRANRIIHSDEYDTALKAWQEALTAETAALAKLTAGGKFDDIKIESRKPSNSLDQYDEVIELLEMSVEENIVLDRDSFRTYVKDEWHWKSAFAGQLFANGSVLTKYSSF